VGGLMLQAETNIREVIKDLQRFFYKRVPAAGLWALEAAAKRVQKRMQEPGKPSTSPVHWDSIRQMRAYFASNGFGGGIPYRRRGIYERGWQLRKNPDGTDLSNRSRGARFIGGLASGADLSPGKKQSSIHKGRYRLLRPTADEEIKRLHQDVIDRLRIEASQ
jgi:hypothetical protein